MLIYSLFQSLPWLIRYPFERVRKKLFERFDGKTHLIFVIANHFEPSWQEVGFCSIEQQLKRMESWKKQAFLIGESLVDNDGTRFRHTYFFPAEQYERRIFEHLSEIESRRLGEVEVHLHHGVERPDTAERLRETLVNFRDLIAYEHGCLSFWESERKPRYAFVHGNLALANSAGGKFCGVDSEMQILHETGCYADFTLPSAPDPSQVPVINQIYECALPFEQRAPHRRGRRLKVGDGQPKMPIIFQGPLLLNWRKPRIENGSLSESYGKADERLKKWISSKITIKGRPNWIFIKLFCHGFFPSDREACIGEKARQFFTEILEFCYKSRKYEVHFATAREAVNMVLAAVDGHNGSPNDFRDYKLKPIRFFASREK
ncbi:MAG: hypothetical protein N2Z23_05025 [Pyrinomonadaceae bacterium]|nr:hypothetical protein [Pyrinomonadaceae bacterium]MCX7639787.1 hypothetical protein [Pyrinomonadaceae bacterium]MDW8304370.1 hypothetical protein [Acidobacteriota bacterium]